MPERSQNCDIQRPFYRPFTCFHSKNIVQMKAYKLWTNLPKRKIVLNCHVIMLTQQLSQHKPVWKLARDIEPFAPITSHFLLCCPPFTPAKCENRWLHSSLPFANINYSIQLAWGTQLASESNSGCCSDWTETVRPLSSSFSTSKSRVDPADSPLS